MATRVRIDGEAEIPIHRWFEVLDKLSRVDDLIELLNKQVDLSNKLLKDMVSILLTLSGLPAPPVEGEPITVITIPVVRNKYSVYEVDLAVANSEKEVKFDATATLVAVVQCDAACSWKRNTVANSSEDLSLGYSVSDFEVSKLYITNTAAVTGSKLKILVEWKE